MIDIFDHNDTYYTGPPLNEDRVRQAERSLGVRLPSSYLAVLKKRNGGLVVTNCFPTRFATSWADDHFEVRALLGIGGSNGIDAGNGQGSADLIKEWGYPDIGLVICDMPSGGHDVVMLDYSSCGSLGEPSVVYVDEDRVPRTIAESFAQFIENLRRCDDCD